MSESPSTGALIVALFVVTALAVVPGVASAVTLEGRALDHDSPGNYTVFPYDDGENAQNTDSSETCIPASEAPTKDEGASGGQNCDPYNGHMPGDKTVSYSQFATGGEAAKHNLSTVDFIVHQDISKDFDMSKCEPNDANVAGFDRNSDESGYKTDEAILAHAENTIEKEHRIIVDLFDDDDLAGNPTYLDTDDEVVAAVEDCYANPEKPGWYQWKGWSNGTTSNGNHAQITLYTHYFYICNCTSRQEAVEKLGPPPSQGGGGGGGSTATATKTATTATTTTATPTSTAGMQSTATPTPTASGESPTPTGKTNQNKQNQQNQNQQNQQQNKNQQQGTPVRTTGGGDRPAPRRATAPATPTIAKGPGFGAGLALASLVAAALLALRRST